MRKIIIYFLNKLALMNLKKAGFVNVPSTSNVEYRKVSFKGGCQLSVGKHSYVDSSISFDRPGSQIKIGDRVFIGSSNIISAESIEIGSDVLISWGCTVVDHNSHAISWSLRGEDVSNWINGKKEWKNVEIKPIKIENKVWIGFNVIVLKGVTIGEGAVVGAGSVVTSNVAPYTIVAGNPARFIREITLDER